MGADESRGVAATEYRTLMSGFPTGVAVITALDRAGNPHGMTCTSFSSVTVTPPVLLASLNLGRGTLRSILETVVFAVNLLHSRGRDAAVIFSSFPGDRFARVRWRPTSRLGLPHLTGAAFALAECVLADCFASGDHLVIFGQVVSVTQSPDTPLLYGLRQFSVWQFTEPTEAARANGDGRAVCEWDGT